VDSLLRLGDSIYRQSPDSAERIWTAALSAARDFRDSAAQARALTGLGQAARQLGDPAASRRLGEQALALKLHLAMKAELFRSYNALGLLALDEERLDDAASLFSRALETAAANGDSTAIIKATTNSGLVAMELGAFQRARSLFGQARRGAESMRDSVTLGRVLDNLGALDVTLGDPIAAVGLLDTARRIARNTADATTEVNARGQLATAYEALGEPQGAFALFDSALVMARHDGRRKEVAEDLQFMAGLFLDAGDFAHALDYYQRSLAATDSLGQPEERGNILRNEARTYSALGNVALAVDRATEARRIHHGVGLTYPELADVIVLASLNQRRGHPAEARSLLDTARVMATALQAPIARVYVGIAEAEIAGEAHDWNRVLSAIARDRTSFGLAGNDAEATALSLEARAQARAGHLDAALVSGRAAIAAVERVRSNYASGELRTTYASRHADVYAEQVLLLLRLKKVDEAFQVADAARGRGLLDHLAAASSEIHEEPQAAAEALLHRIDALVSKLQERESRSPRERTASSVALSKELRDSLLVARSEYEALVARAAPPTGARSLATSDVRPPVAEIARRLRPDEVLLEYFVVDDRVLIFALTPSGLTVHSADEGPAALASRVQLARDLLQRRDDTASARLVLSALYDVLIGPVAKSGVLRNATRLVVVPHGPLVYLPFSALVDPASGQFLAERFGVLKLATAASLPWLRHTVATNVGNPVPGAQVFVPFPDRLPSTHSEATEIVRFLPSAQIYLGPQATKSNLRRALESGAFVHVATHANMNPRNPLFSQLDLSMDRQSNGQLAVHELLAYRVAAPLVFLSGCETALGGAWFTRFDREEDYTTIAETVLYAGAGNVVATLWRIDDSGAAAFAAHFYRSLGSEGVAGGLARAQRAMLADPRYRSPYYWAAYEVTGSDLLPTGVSVGARKSEGDVR
jgi:CHAT domain-containing protein/tetratricopeptide (TPR) repeat protein